MEERTERQVIEELSAVERELLKRILEIERSRLHAQHADVTEDILNAVKGIVQ